MLSNEVKIIRSAITISVTLDSWNQIYYSFRLYLYFILVLHVCYGRGSTYLLRSSLSICAHWTHSTCFHCI